MVDEEIVEQEPVQDSGQEMVELHRASLDDIDAALENAKTQEQAVPEVDVPDSDSTSQTENPNEQPETSGKPEGSVVAAQGANPAKPTRLYTQEEIQGILAENERQKKEGDKKELFIQHRGNELGRIRTENAALKAQLEQARNQLANGLEDRFSENPIQASNDRDKIKDLDARIEDIDQREERASRIVEAQTFFLRNVDIDKVSLDDVAEVLRADGLDERYVAQFKANPWEFTSPEALVQFGKRAADRKGFVEADNDRRVLAKHVMTLNEEIKKLRAKPGQVMQQVQRNLNQRPGVTSASSASPKTVRDLDPTRMTVAELDAALKHASMN